MPASAKRREKGFRLRESRLAVNMSQEQAAAALGVSAQSISAWELGERSGDWERLADLCLLYGVSSDYILYGTHMVPEDLRVLFQRNGTARRDP